MIGETDKVISAYLAEDSSKELVYTAAPSLDRPKVIRVAIDTSAPGNFHVHGKPFQLTFDIATPYSITSAVFSFKILDSTLQPIAHLWLFDAETPFCRKPGVHRLVCRIPRLRLYMGQYSIRTHLSEEEGGRYFETLDNICPFEVVMHGISRRWRWSPGDCKYLEEGEWIAQH